ncbi:MAG: alpha/beta hydrolase [Sphingomonadales bacterium]|nr:alpha/beta hydrolase [Sphingomonadales bacterium]
MTTHTTGADTLVVLLHAFTSSPAKLKPIAKVVQGEWPQARLFCPQLPASTFSMANPNVVVAQLLNEIDRQVQEAQTTAQSIENIVLIGHSIGALLARKIYVVACGETPDASFEAEFRTGSDEVKPRPWAGKVSRVVLMAAMNRGWHLSHHLELWRAPFWAAGVAIGNIIYLLTGRWPLIMTLRRGAPFIAQLRLQWLGMRRGQRGNALVVQVLGSRDDLVSPEDNVDLVSGGDFYYLDARHSGHASVVQLDDRKYGEDRKKVFLTALKGTPHDLEKESVVPSDQRFPGRDEDVKRVLFVMHGIRDAGYWTHKLARQVQRLAKEQGIQDKWATETSSYGYFPMLPFLLSAYRRKNVEWLMDRYAEVVARYPNATVSYIGHSNGTYLLAKALELYPGCRFDKVVFAGSVVGRAYPWSRYTVAQPPSNRPRVNYVLNFVATGDWVVAFFPKLFQFLGGKDLGSAGHDGFALAEHTPNVYQLTYVKGGHGAAVEEDTWQTIANFIVNDPSDAKPALPRPRKWRNWIVLLLGLFPPLIWLALAALLVAVWLGLYRAIAALVTDPSWTSFFVGISLTVYLLLLWLVVTRV